jgi:LAO/AO transport system kinase
MKKTKYHDIPDTAMFVQSGIDQPSAVNDTAVKAFMQKKLQELAEEDFHTGILAGNRTILSKAITLIESSLYKHQLIAQKIIEKCLSDSGRSIRIGITGVPGVGKSTFIEALGKYLTGQGHKVAVLAIDPSSSRSKGSILGDKTRMEELAVDKNAFIRPSPSAGTLGGVARKTWETIILCEAAGFDVIFIETVGVGQSEVAVHSMTDFFLLLMLAGAGDELQGIKRGIMEMADAIIINKADGSNINKAKLARSQYENALHLFPPHESDWSPLVQLCSSVERTGIPEVWDLVKDYAELTKNNGYFDGNRLEQMKQRMYQTINEGLILEFYNNDKVKKQIKVIEQELVESKITSYAAAQKLSDIFKLGNK